MTQVSNLQSHDYTFRFSTPVGIWRWTTRLDVSQSNPSFTIRDIVSPYGLLRDSIPIPGDVVKKMADSIDELKNSFAPAILMSPSSLTFTVDEGRGYAPASVVQVSNNGVYGSLLGVTLTTSANYIITTPTKVGNLAFNEAGTFDVMVTSTNLVAGSSPYSGTVTVQDPNASNNPVVYPITINVRPKATVSRSPTSLSFSVVKPTSGPFPSIATQQFTVTNSGPSGSILEYTVQKLTGLSDWLTGIVPSTGTLTSSQSSSITLTVAPADTLAVGTYTETLRISGYSSNSYQDIQIQLVVT